MREMLMYHQMIRLDKIKGVLPLLENQNERGKEGRELFEKLERDVSKHLWN
jgi:hypothetical protein